MFVERLHIHHPHHVVPQSASRPWFHSRLTALVPTFVHAATTATLALSSPSIPIIRSFSYDINLSLNTLQALLLMLMMLVLLMVLLLLLLMLVLLMVLLMMLLLMVQLVVLLLLLNSSLALTI